MTLVSYKEDQMKNRVVSIILAALLVIMCLPAMVYAEPMKLIVNNVDVLTAADMTDVLGDGTVSFDRSSGVLTLRNASLAKGASDSSEEWAEHPAILFSGSLTIHLVGNNSISTGTSNVMGQALRNNAIVGDDLIVTADQGASLDVKGMVQVNSYTQEGGQVNIELSNSHGKITKWALYVMGSAFIKGGTLKASTVGKNKNGAIGLDENAAFKVTDGAQLLENNTKVSSLNFSGKQMRTSKNSVEIKFADSSQSSGSGNGTTTSQKQDSSSGGTAYESRQTVDLNGTAVSLPAYALLNEKGDPTNYVRLRDLASLLNGTSAQFDVLWSAETGISIAPHTSYDHPNGSEGNIPFSGNKPYTIYSEKTTVGTTPQSLTAFQITDDAGGSHTYYQLRDLGRALGFNVGWSAERGIFIEPDVPYTDAN